MSVQVPPNVTVFNGEAYNASFFTPNSQGLTYQTASQYFLEYPNSQGTETFQYPVSVTDTTESTNTSTGCFVASGGISCAKNSNIGGSQTVSNGFTLSSGTLSLPNNSEAIF